MPLNPSGRTVVQSAALIGTHPSQPANEGSNPPLEPSNPTIPPNIPLQLCFTRHGPLLALPTDHYVGGALMAYGEFSEGEVAFFKQIVRPEWTIVEVGANCGALTVPLANLVPQGGVVAFEPQPLQAALLRANIGLARLTKRVVVVEKAVGRTAGTVWMPNLDPLSPNNFGGIGVEESAPEGAGWMQIPQVRLDDQPIKSCGLLKVDAEGSELAILEGGKALIEGCKPVLYFENDRPAQSKALIDFVRGLGYQPFWLITWLFNPDNWAGEAENAFGNAASFNVAAFPEGWEVSGLHPVREGREAAPVGVGLGEFFQE